ncbi:MAG: hypothetical protein AAGD01_05350 [Acidobacteriota bacterium]
MSKDTSPPETSHEATKKSLNKQKLFSYFLLLASGALFFVERLQEPPFPLDFGPLSAAGLTVLTAAIFSHLYLSEIGEYRMDLTHHSEEIKELTKKISELQSMAGLGDSVLELNARSSGRVFTPLLTSKLIAVRADIADMASGTYEFNYRRKREAYAEEFKEIIKAMLNSGTTFQTVTNTIFWSDSGINVADQYMGAMLNSLALHKGLKVQRLIIVPKTRTSAETQIINRHARDLVTYEAPMDRCKTKVRAGPQNSDSLLRWIPAHSERIWNHGQTSYVSC